MKDWKWIGICLLCGVLFSCSEDLGNYDYHELTEPEITGVEAKMSVLTFERLQLTPDLGSHDFSAERYGFEWKAVATDGSDEVTVLGTARELDYEVRLPEGMYKLYFTVTEKSSGVYWQQNYDLQVSQATSEGWMVLCSDGGRARLDMVSVVTGRTYFDVLKDNGMPVLNGPRRIQHLSAELAPSGSPFDLLTDDGATRLGKNGFEWKEEYRVFYEMGNGAEPFPYEIVYMPNGFKVMVSGTDLYFAALDIGLYGFPVNKDFRVAPKVGCNVSTKGIMYGVALLYDMDHKQLVGYCPGLGSDFFGNLESLYELNEFGEIADDFAKAGRIKTGVIGEAFDRFPEGLDYVYMESTKYDPGNGKMGITYTVLADGDRRYVYGIQLGDMLTYMDCSAVLGKAYYGDISGCTGITGVTDLFAFSSLKNYMYYAVGGTVYRVDLSGQPLRAEKQFTLPGETITCLKFNLYRGNKYAERIYDLVVGSVKGNEGLLRVYDGSDLDGDFKGKTPELYQGFAPIVDVEFRELTN